MKIASIAILLVSAALFASAARAQQKCPAPPALSAGTGANIFSSQQELDLGDVEAEWLEKNYHVIHDDDIAARLNLTTSRILAQLPSTQLKFRIILIDSPVVNAFSVGAGRIYVTRKMVAFVRNDVYDLKSLEKRSLLTFPYHIAAWSFSADGQRVFILTANQMAYIFDSQALGRAETATAIAP